MVTDERARRLLGDELELLGQGQSDTLRLEQGEDVHLVLEPRARGVAEAVAAALVRLAEETLDRAQQLASNFKINFA